MPSFPIPPDEDQRVAALARCRVLDTPPEPVFDDIAYMASQLCGTPIALVSLIDSSRQWFKARIGLDFSETSRGSSLCAHAIVAKGPMVVRDALADPRFSAHPLVTSGPRIRFYAAVPLIVDRGSALGTVCVMDHVPRELTPAQLESLKALARRASAELSLRSRATHEASQSRAAQSRDRAADSRSDDTTGPFFARAAKSARSKSELPVKPHSLIGDRYRVEGAIGAGGMGVVARALDTRLAQPVAIKFMRATNAPEPHALRRFAREAQVLFSLESEHIARVLDFGWLPEGAPFIVMELLEGMDLAALLRREGRLSIAQSLDVLSQACAAVQVAHDAGILHRDLKPANLFLTSSGARPACLKVLDFGISKLVETSDADLETALTGAATELGSPSYMAPEQMLNAADVDVRCDVWSLGVVLYELLAGRTPFAGATRIEVCSNVLTAPVPPLLCRSPQVPHALCAIIERCLEKQPERRYGSVAALGRALRGVDAPAHARYDCD